MYLKYIYVMNCYRHIIVKMRKMLLYIYIYIYIYILHMYILNTSVKLLYINCNVNTTVNNMASHSVCTV